MKKFKKAITAIIVTAMLTSAFSAIPFTANAAEVNVPKVSQSRDAAHYVVTSGDYRYENIDGKSIIFWEYLGSDTDVVIPEQIDGKTVTMLVTDPQKLDLKNLTLEVGIFMSKYSYEFKKKVVMDYINGKGGYKSLCKENGIPSQTILRDWITAYKEFGNKGLMRSREKKNYSFEFKMHVVELYLTTEVSYRELALSLGINNPPMIAKWVTDYRAVGPDALRPKRKGRKPKVSKTKKIIPNTGKEKAESEYLKQLEDENLRLRIENAYLKELRRLRLEEEKPPKNRQE